jgi:hypothetical protein
MNYAIAARRRPGSYRGQLRRRYLERAVTNESLHRLRHERQNVREFQLVEVLIDLARARVRLWMIDGLNRPQLAGKTLARVGSSVIVNISRRTSRDMVPKPPEGKGKYPPAHDFEGARS